MVEKVSCHENNPYKGRRGLNPAHPMIIFIRVVRVVGEGEGREGKKRKGGKKGGGKERGREGGREGGNYFS